MENEQPAIQQNKFKKIFTPTVIIVLVIVDIVIGALFCLLRNFQIKRSISTEYSEVTDNEVSDYLFASEAAKTRIISGTVNSIDIHPDKTAINKDIQHQIKWSYIVVNITPDEDASKDFLKCLDELDFNINREDISVMFTPDTEVFEVDTYGNVNSDTLSIGNRVSIYCSMNEETNSIKAIELIKNLRQETDTSFQNMLQKVTSTEFIVDIYSVILISIFVCMLIYSIKNSTKEYIDSMIFTAIFLFIGIVISAIIINSAVKEQKATVAADDYYYKCDTEYSLNYLAFEGMEGMPEFGSKKSDGSDAIALYDAFPYMSDDNFLYKFDSFKHLQFHNYNHRAFYNKYIENSEKDNRYRPDQEKIHSFPDSKNWTSQYYSSMYTYDTPQRALYEFDAYADFCKTYTPNDEIFSNIYFSDNEIIIYRKLTHPQDYERYELLYMRLDDNVLVLYEVVICDFETEEVAKAKQFFKKVGIDADKVEFTADLTSSKTR